METCAVSQENSSLDFNNSEKVLEQTKIFIYIIWSVKILIAKLAVSHQVFIFSINKDIWAGNKKY